MTANSAEDDAFHLLSGLGALGTAAVLEPPANARYRPPTAVLSFDAGSPQTQPIQVTNAGTKPWIASGAGSVRLIWEIRDSTKKVVSSAPAPIPLPALAPAASANVTLSYGAPVAVGDYTLTVGLVDANGTALPPAPAPTCSFTLHLPIPFPPPAPT